MAPGSWPVSPAAESQPRADGSWIVADAPAWFEHDRAGSGDSDPTGRASFGLFAGNQSVTFMREVR